MTTTIPTPRPTPTEPDGSSYDEDGNWYPTKEALTAHVEGALKRLGITRDDLARQAEDDWFEPGEGLTLWMMVRYLDA